MQTIGTKDNSFTPQSQIDDRSYAVKWSADGRRVTKCGAVIDSTRRNLTHWRVADESGNVVDEKIFEV